MTTTTSPKRGNTARVVSLRTSHLSQHSRTITLRLPSTPLHPPAPKSSHRFLPHTHTPPDANRLFFLGVPVSVVRASPSPSPLPPASSSSLSAARRTRLPGLLPFAPKSRVGLAWTLRTPPARTARDRVRDARCDDGEREPGPSGVDAPELVPVPVPMLNHAGPSPVDEPEAERVEEDEEEEEEEEELLRSDDAETARDRDGGSGNVKDVVRRMAVFSAFDLGRGKPNDSDRRGFGCGFAKVGVVGDVASWFWPNVLGEEVDMKRVGRRGWRANAPRGGDADVVTGEAEG
jgi:hypothetical protein